MKTKKILFIPLTLVASALVVGTIAGIKSYQQLDADDDYQTYIPVSSGWVETYERAGRSVGDLLRGRNDRFWSGEAEGWNSQERTFNAMDEFVDTIHKADGEEWKGAYRTPELTLHDNNHRYISFLFGGGAQGAEGDIFFNIYQITGAAGAGDRMDHVRTFFNGTGSFDDKETKLNAPISCNMVFRYYELPSQIQPGDKFLIYVEDGKTGNYGGFTFGDVYINQTLEDCARNFSAHKAQMKLNEFTSDWNRNANEFVLNYYATDSYYEAVRNAEANLTDANDGFEINNHLSRWAYDQQNSTYEDGRLAGINYSYIYSDKEIKWGGYFYDNDGRMPINKTGNLFLSGEPEGMDGPNCGLPESAKYRLVSPEFTLSGTGLISAKIGGHFTALQLLDSNFNVIATTGDVNPSFADKDMTNIAQSGGRQCTMTRTYLDCGAFVGQRVHIALADTRTGGDWNLAYFDEIETNYQTNPVLKVDVFRQHIGKSENDFHYGYILDQYVDNGHNPVFKEAFDFLSVYYANFRSPVNEFDIAKADDDAKLAVANAYLPLSNAAKTLIGQSVDIRYTETFNKDTWFNYAVNVENNVPESEIATLVSGLVAEHGTSTVSFNANGGTESMASVTVVNTTKFSSFPCQFKAPEGKKFLRWNTASDDSGLSTTVSENATLYAIWVDTAKTQIEALPTKTTLSFSPKGNAQSGFEYENIKIRFKGALSSSLWAELNGESEIKGFGVMVSLGTATEGYLGSKHFEDEYNDKLAAASGDVDAAISALIGNNTKIQNFYLSCPEDSPASNGEVLSWALPQSVSYSSSTTKVHVLTRDYVAVAYIRTNDGIVFFDEARVSVKDLAQQMIDSDDYDESSMGGSLYALAHIGENN